MKKQITSNTLFAILITVILHVVAFLYMNLSTLETKPTIYEDMAIMELDYRTQEQIEEMLEPKEPVIDESNQSIKDLMQDIQDIRNKSLNDFSESQITQEVEQEVLNRNKENSTQQNEKGTEKSESNNSQTSEKTKENNTNSSVPEKKNSYGGKVTKYCNVPGRECNTVAPSYRCKGGGKVRIDIKVDKIGRVKSVSVNTSKSTTTNECLINEALDYAKRTTKVSSDLDGKHSNRGYVEYNFVSQK